jgi:hypothetical protein
MRTRDLLNLRNTGHPGINSLFAKAHSADWDFENDVDWTVAIAADDPLVEHGWGAYGQTPTFQALPEHAKRHATRRAVGRMLNILQVGESVAQNVCAKLVLLLHEEDYRNHAAAQAMDEARHHLAYRRFIDRMARRSRTSIPAPRCCSTRCSRRTTRSRSSRPSSSSSRAWR